MSGLRPSTVIREIVNGVRSDRPHWTHAGLSMTTYRYACEVLSERTRAGRRAALDRVPVGIREDVEREAKALWNNRGQGK